ncbi:response regulator transcription factor [Planotetraspora phitsanulokensis]|uniref:DNA-binding response regulator n=2 Tax=Planotetraspora phitsanulokensis TaxID=575192 RepID=A0A8J3U0L6_9ACTN|nr:DNA-binding response regulator [Planotetraspora phitsanulokensis]
MRMDTDRDASAAIRVLLADDHPALRRGLALLLETLPGIDVVAQAGDGEATLREVALHRPDVVVMDLHMPVMDGVETTARVVRDHPSTAVLVLTMVSEDTMVTEALRAGARGYLLKTAESDEIERAIRAVAAGDAIFSQAVAGRLIDRLSTREPPLPQLSPREREVLDEVATGATNGAIALRLHLSHKTVANHVSAILMKLGVATRGQAIVIAKDAGLGRRG